jgi:hypothetical protein
MPLDAAPNQPRLDVRCLAAAMPRLCALGFDEACSGMIHQTQPYTGLRPASKKRPGAGAYRD